MRQHNGGRTGIAPNLDNHNRARCPHCGRYIKFDESIDNKGIKCHIWTCEFCWSFSEHYHEEFGQSYLRYNDSSKECYCR